MTMILGTYTFDKDPASCSLPMDERRCDDVLTVGGVAFFSWGTFIAGQQIILKWPAVSTTQFDQLRTLLLADEEIEWHLSDDSSAAELAYNVEIKNLKGKYHMSRLADAPYRKDVELHLLIVSEVT